MLDEISYDIGYCNSRNEKHAYFAQKVADVRSVHILEKISTNF